MKKAGASREEIISAIMVGLPAVGNEVINALPAAWKHLTKIRKMGGWQMPSQFFIEYQFPLMLFLEH